MQGQRLCQVGNHIHVAFSLDFVQQAIGDLADMRSAALRPAAEGKRLGGRGHAIEHGAWRVQEKHLLDHDFSDRVQATPKAHRSELLPVSECAQRSSDEETVTTSLYRVTTQACRKRIPMHRIFGAEFDGKSGLKDLRALRGREDGRDSGWGRSPLQKVTFISTFRLAPNPARP